MLLAIDSGNTNIVFAVYEGDRRRGEWRSSSVNRLTADEYAVWLIQLMALQGMTPADVTDAIIANVVPAVTFDLRTLCRRYFNCDPLIVGESGVELGIDVHMDMPKEEIGADRLVNAIGAAGRYPLPLIVVDFGTATTFDVVDAKGDYCGGVIAPGINLSLEALNLAAAKLPRIAVKKPPSVIGKSTVPAMQSGVYWGYISLIEGVVRRIAEEFGSKMTVVATGGLAPLFAEAVDAIEHLDPDLTLRGLVEIHRRNKRP
ncbi:MAG: type III pantothenate kinase [Candidatus Eiseniibacteriota bacterium]